MAERGITVDHSTLHCWVIRLVPLLDKGFRKAICHHGAPEVVTVDKNGANTAVQATLNGGKPDEIIVIRLSKYLNNLIEQDHQNIKRIIHLMLGFKLFRRAQTLHVGIELLHLIRKGQNQLLQSDGLSHSEKFYLLRA